MMMTREEILDIAGDIIAKLPKRVETATLDRNKEKVLPDYVMGWNGLARLFGVSVNTAKKRYNTGALGSACKFVDGKLITRPELAVKLWAEYKENERKN